MKLLLNDKEIAHFLLSLIDHYPFIRSVSLSIENTQEAVTWVEEKLNHPKYADKIKSKAKEKINRAVEQDLREYWDEVRDILRERKEYYYEKVHGNINFFIDQLGEENILKLYKKSSKQNFVKSVGFNLEPNSQLVRRSKFNDYSENCLIRNTVGNEKLLISKIDQGYPFWFIDSGYTNFLESKKVWHRLEKNHLHYGKYFEAPVDRLNIFKTFPAQWRTDGDKILVVEPGPFAAGIFHVDLSTWKYEIEAELKKYTDKKIVFREKAPKRERTNLYQHLCDEDYYCVISINSNAATEAIWAGIPAITLGKHITNPVTTDKLSDINNLKRPHLANWLSMLSYSQWTYDELINGTAAKMVKKYHV